MPNWCENKLIVTGGQKQGLDIFAEFAKGEKEELTANAFIPYPKEFEEKDRIASAYMEEHPDDDGNCPEWGFGNGGYEWCRKFWGCKWDFSFAYGTRVSDNELVYNFDTPWSPPLPVIVAMGEMFPALNFKLEYWEMGCGFQGVFIVENGAITLDETKDYYPFDCEGDDDLNAASSSCDNTEEGNTQQNPIDQVVSNAPELF